MDTRRHTKLTPAERELLRRAFAAGFSVRNIAARTQLPVSTVYRAISQPDTEHDRLASICANVRASLETDDTLTLAKRSALAQALAIAEGNL